MESESPESAESGTKPEAAPTSVEIAATERAAKPPVPRMEGDPYMPQVERIMESNLWDVYLTLPEDFRAQFKKLGEDTSLAIRALIVQAHVRASKIHDLVHKWLKKIPGVNEWFLLQESKIKTDQFMRMVAWIVHRGGLG